MPPPPIVIDKAHARRFLLAHHHLLPPRTLSGKHGVLAYVRKVNCIQYDPINVVGQNPHLVLQSRVRGYRPDHLNSLLYEDRKLLDGFDKQMSIYPVEDWPQFAYYREHMARKSRENTEAAAAARLVGTVREQIRARGPVSSLELEDSPRMDWWLTGSVRAARIALDLLLYGGDTVVHHRVGTRRYFDLTERVLPRALIRAAKPHASSDEYLEWHVFRRAGGLGLLEGRITAKFGGTLGWQGGRIRTALASLVEKGRLVPVAIAELPRHQFFVRQEDLPALETAARLPRGKPAASLIAPLDNVMWDLNVIRMLFHFDYAWEVYKPAEKRNYGYYVLPVLYGDRFLARMDPGFDRVGKILTIKNWWWEKDVDHTEETMLAAIGKCLSAFARYLGAKDICLDPPAKSHAGLIRAVKSRVE